ncbi:MAG: DUF4189 domain-containing protein [Pseudanabaena sp. RU_4_16]|nr:DUF4189 domain-containing protein [Pseudanabaena sp. SU_2_4]NJM27402.1 DUF4189 domain-containing protein [Pseudanabaena sp. RU_4_16]
MSQRVSQSNNTNIPPTTTEKSTASSTETPTASSTETPTATSTATSYYFGAIARSREGGKGYSWNYTTQAEAEQRAINECSEISTTKNCEVLVWFRNACGSIAEASDGGAGSGWGADESLAERNALQSCSTVGSGCKITRTICTKK